MNRNFLRILFLEFFLFMDPSWAKFSPYEPSIFQQDIKNILDNESLLFAKKMTVSQEEGCFWAQGNVILQQEKLLLKTEQIFLDEKNGHISISKPFMLQEGSGDTLSGQSAWFSKEKNAGQIKMLKVLTNTRERLTAKKASKENNQYALQWVSYTPCEHCQDRLPLWSLHAEHISQEEKGEIVHAKNAYLKFYDFPVLYLPVVYIPVKRRAGFLKPDLRSSKELGFYFSLPYYWPINASGNNDLLLKPFVTTQGGIILSKEYRHRLNNGMVTLKGALNVTKKQYFQSKTGEETELGQCRGYVNGNIAYDLNEHWRFRSDEWWVTDKTFLSTRPFFGKSTDPFLQSETKLEGFYQNHFASIRGIRYQGLLEGESNRQTPYIYPEASYSLTLPKCLGGIGQLNVENLSFFQEEGQSLQRNTVEGLWSNFWNPWERHLFHSIVRLEGDSYCWKNTSPLQSHASKGSVRSLAQASLKWNYSCYLFPWILTPMVQMVASSPSNNSEFPNKDSFGSTFTDANLFEINRIPGRDRIDDASRMNYGFQTTRNLGTFSVLRFLVGQSYSFSEPPELLVPLGVFKGFSNVVGLVETHFSQPIPLVLCYRFQQDKKNLSSRFQEVFASLGNPCFNVSGSYIFVHPFKDLSRNVRASNQLFLTVSSLFLKFWTIKVFMTQNFSTLLTKQKLLEKGISVAYEDECFAMGFSIQRSFYRMQDLKPGFSTNFFLQLKNLGGTHERYQRFSRQH